MLFREIYVAFCVSPHQPHAHPAKLLSLWTSSSTISSWQRWEFGGQWLAAGLQRPTDQTPPEFYRDVCGQHQGNKHDSSYSIILKWSLIACEDILTLSHLCWFLSTAWRFHGGSRWTITTQWWWREWGCRWALRPLSELPLTLKSLGAPCSSTWHVPAGLTSLSLARKPSGRQEALHFQ